MSRIDIQADSATGIPDRIDSDDRGNGIKKPPRSEGDLPSSADNTNPSAFITNFQAPKQLDELIECFIWDGLTNLDKILAGGDMLGEWTVDRNCKPCDTVFFMCAKTSIDHMQHVYAEAKRYGAPRLLRFAEEQRALYERYAGSIVAIGKVLEEPFEADSGYENAHWKSPWYAKIGQFKLLDDPVSIDDFRNFITVSRTGAITKLSTNQTNGLLNLILF